MASTQSETAVVACPGCGSPLAVPSVYDRPACPLRSAATVGVYHSRPQPISRPQQKRLPPNRKKRPRCPSTSASTAVFATRDCLPSRKMSASSLNALIAVHSRSFRRRHRRSPKTCCPPCARRRAIRTSGTPMSSPSEPTSSPPQPKSPSRFTQMPPMRHRHASNGEPLRAASQVPRLRNS